MAFFFFAQIASQILPSYYSSDFSNMVDIAEGVVSGVDVSLAVIASLISVFSVGGLTLIVNIAGALIFFFVLSGRKKVSTTLVALLSLAILAPLALVRPQKEILVLVLTAFCTWGVMRSKTPMRALVLIVTFYILYSYISLRPYYVLITGLIPLLFFFVRMSPRKRYAILCVVFIVGFFVPNGIYEQLRATRDAINDLRVLYPDMEGNRTAFSNPIQSGGWIGFLINYCAAVVRLNFPLLYWQTLNEVAMTLFSGSWFYFMYRGVKTQDWRALFMVRLLLCHLLILWIFEPDLGSYLRHLSSCVLYLIPIFRAVEGQCTQTPLVSEIFVSEHM